MFGKEKESKCFLSGFPWLWGSGMTFGSCQAIADPSKIRFRVVFFRSLYGQCGIYATAADAQEFSWY
jgi:uncharacterized protein YfiM (DUF2279 family)